MPLVTKPYTFTNGIASDAQQVNQDLDTLYNLINGLLDAVNIATNGLNDPNKFASEVITQAKSKGLVYTQDLYGQSWVVSGGATTASGSPANQITVTTLVANILQADGSYRRVIVGGATYVTSIINATYFLELQPDGTMNWSQTHSVQANYMPIATVTSNASGNINVITDTRVTALMLKGTSVKTPNTTLDDGSGNPTFKAITANSLQIPTDAAGGSYAVRLGRSGAASTKAYVGTIGTNVGIEFDYMDAGGTGQQGFNLNSDGTLTRAAAAYTIWDSGNLGAGLFAHSTFGTLAQGVSFYKQYQKLPGGLIMQWGYTDIVATGSVITFPVAFPNGTMGSVLATPVNTSGTTTITTTNANTTQFTAYMSTSAAFGWIAFGY